MGCAKRLIWWHSALTLVALLVALSVLAPTAAAQAVQPDCSTVAGNRVGDCGFESASIGTTPNLVDSNAGAAYPDPTNGPWIGGSNGYEIDNKAASAEFNPNSGRQSVDINASGTGSPSQNISTQPGHLYSVSFALAGNAAIFSR